MSLHVGLDFGTTNSAVAAATPQGLRFATFMLNEAPTASFRSILFYDPEKHAPRPGQKPLGSAGVDAIADYLDACGEGRLVQSIKTYLASGLFNSTTILNRTLCIEELVARILSELWRHAHISMGVPSDKPTSIVMGRPVHFAGGAKGPAMVDSGQDQDAFAQERLRRAAKLAGFDRVVFEYEPIAAACHFEQQLKTDAIVLVADFGGGTSDFCLMRVGPSFRNQADRSRDILATGGIGIAGDDFDAKLIRHVVADALGRGTRYTEMGATTEIPLSLFHRLERWHHLSFLKEPSVMASLERFLRGAEDPKALQNLLHIITWNQGFHLHKCVERTKVELSKHHVADFVYHDPPVRIERTVHRRDFETWIAPEVAQIRACTLEVLERAEVAPHAVSHVFLTGGTAFVPCVRQIFADVFGSDKLRGGDELLSIAGGLAARAAALSASL